jgi:thiol-disulfide isomerase/thioredoxin
MGLTDQIAPGVTVTQPRCTFPKKGWMKASYAVCGLVVFLALSGATTAANAAPRAARVAPAFHLPTAQGYATLDSLRGRVVLVDFWASWCAPCKRSFPWMSALHDSLADRGLEVVAINLDKDPGAAEQFLAHNPARFTVAFDPAGTSAEAYGVQAMPTSYLVGRDGKVLMTHAGFDPRATGKLEAAILKACPR